MTLAVVWLPEAMTAYRTLRAADPEGASRISYAVAMLGEHPWPEGSNALGDTAFRRLRLDQYRVLYELVPGTVRVMHVGRVIPV
jgi:mRNA-degrading endonuclease RelE of RelBE toxin-antitoxin system